MLEYSLYQLLAASSSIESLL